MIHINIYIIELKDFKKVIVPVLNKYLVEHNMKDHMKLQKHEKLELIKDHILRRKLGIIVDLFSQKRSKWKPVTVILMML